LTTKLKKPKEKKQLEDLHVQQRQSSDQNRTIYGYVPGSG
jgi:hypothetical protein